MGARRWFHILLGAIFLPGVSLPLEWGAALRSWSHPGDAEDRRWSRRLLGLAAVDTLVVAALVVSFTTGQPLDREPASLPRRVAIGVTPDPSFHGRGVRLGGVLPGSPAASAGLRVGDVLLSAEGKPVDSPDALRALLTDRGPGVPVDLGVLRAGAPTTVRVTTVWSTALRPPRRGLFQADPGACLPSPRRWPWAESLGLAGLLALALVATRRGAGRGVWLTVLAILGGSVGALVASVGTCLLSGGPSTGAAVLGLWGGSIGLGATALFGRALTGPVAETATRDVPTTVLLGLWYAYPGMLRLVVLLLTLRAFLPWSAPFESPIRDLAQSAGGTDGPGFLFLGLGAVVLAPVGEELAFRGLLLPSLRRWVGTRGAIGLSSAIFGALHWYYGIGIPVLIFVGLVLGWARVVSGGLRAPILIHAGFNLVPITLLGLKLLRGG